MTRCNCSKFAGTFSPCNICGKLKPCCSSTARQTKSCPATLRPDQRLIFMAWNDPNSIQQHPGGNDAERRAKEGTTLGWFSSVSQRQEPPYHSQTLDKFAVTCLNLCSWLNGWWPSPFAFQDLRIVLLYAEVRESNCLTVLRNHVECGITD